MKITNRNSSFLCYILFTRNLLIIFCGLIISEVIINYDTLLQIICFCYVIILFYYNFLQNHVFQYENREGILFLKNENFFKFINLRQSKFSKYLLLDFEIKNTLFRKKLYITQNRSENILVFDITYLSDTEIQILTEDFKKIIIKNSFYRQKQFIPVG